MLDYNQYVVVKMDICVSYPKFLQEYSYDVEEN